MLNVVLLNIVTLNVIILSIVMLNVECHLNYTKCSGSFHWVHFGAFFLETDLMNFLSVSNSSDFVSVEIDAEEAVLGAEDHPVLVDEAGGQGGRVLDDAHRVVQHFATTEHRSVCKILVKFGDFLTTLSGSMTKKFSNIIHGQT